MGIEATERPRSKISLQARSIGYPNRVRRVVAHLGQDRRSDFAAGNRWLTHTGREVSPSGLKASMVTVRGSLVQGTRGLGRRLRLAGPKGRSVRRFWGVGNPVAWRVVACGRFRCVRWSPWRWSPRIGWPRWFRCRRIWCQRPVSGRISKSEKRAVGNPEAGQGTSNRFRHRKWVVAGCSGWAHVRRSSKCLG